MIGIRQTNHMVVQKAQMTARMRPLGVRTIASTTCQAVRMQQQLPALVGQLLLAQQGEAARPRTTRRRDVVVVITASSGIPVIGAIALTRSRSPVVTAPTIRTMKMKAKRTSRARGMPSDLRTWDCEKTFSGACSTTD